MRYAGKDSGIVYSTENGRMCPQCGRAARECVCKKKGSQPSSPIAPAVPADGVVRIMRQTKGRKGKGVTLVAGLALDPVALAALAKTLKQKCGAGGALKDGVIEIQGDQRQTLLAELAALGYKVKLAGG